MTILAITTDAWLTLAIVLALFASLSLTRIRTEAAFLYAIAALFVTTEGAVTEIKEEKPAAPGNPDMY